MATVNETIQWLFDNAAAIAIDRSPIVATTTTRENVYQSRSRGGVTTRFRVTPAPGLYSEFRPYLARLEQIDRVQVANINFTADVWDDIFGPLGDPVWSARWTGGFQGYQITGQTNKIDLAGSPVSNVTTQLRAVPSDWIKISGQDSVYQVTAAVYQGINDTRITLDKDLDNPTFGTASTYVGNQTGNLNFDVLCVERPTWTLISAGPGPIVTWNGDFVFYEDLT